jgi:acyl dehydratase
MSAQVGDELPQWRNDHVDAARMKTMALLLRDSNPLHFDPDTVRKLEMGDRVVNQGPINLAFVMRMLGAWAGGLDHLRRLRVRYLGNVFAGDAVVAGGTVTAVHEHGGELTAECTVWLEVAGRGRVLEGTATVGLRPS